MLVYIVFNDGSYGYYECESVYIDSNNIETSEVYFSRGSSLLFCSLRSVTLCKDGGVPTRILFERRDGHENNFNGEHQKL